MNHAETFRGLLYFLWAGACQLTGAFFLWSMIRGNKSIPLGILGVLMLIGSAFILALHHTPFGRMYAAYAGVLAVMALLWGWHYTGVRPDVLDMIGTIMVLGGIGIIFLIPRS